MWETAWGVDELITLREYAEVWAGKLQEKWTEKVKSSVQDTPECGKDFNANAKPWLW